MKTKLTEGNNKIIAKGVNVKSSVLDEFYNRLKNDESIIYKASQEAMRKMISENRLASQ